MKKLLTFFTCLFLCISVMNNRRVFAATSEPNVVVGNGTQASCTEAALNTAIAQGGVITFNCGSTGHTIKFTTYKQINQAMSIDGGNLITLSGNNTTSLFQVFSGVRFSLSNITLSEALGKDGFGTIDNFGTLIINNSRIENNKANTFNGGALTNHSIAEISDTVFFNNSAANSNGGAIYNDSGTTTLTRTQILSNTAGNGGAIYSRDGAITMFRTHVLSNTAHYGGGINIFGGTFIANNLIVRENIGFDGGGMWINQNVTATIQRSEFSANNSQYGAGLEVSGKLIMTNTTLSGNTAINDGGGIWFLNTSDTSQLNSVTLYQNQATNGGAINSNGGSVVLKNSALTGSGSVSPPLCAGDVITADITNFASDGTCGAATLSGDIRLQPLADNGGFTLSHLPTVKSVLIDAVDTCPSIDQRGVLRPKGIRCDVGSVELAPDSTTFLPAMLREYVVPFNGRFEIEPNNSIATANSFLISNVACIGFPDDVDDYYGFTVSTAGAVTIQLTGHSGENINKLQLQLRNASNTLITFAFAPPYTINIANLPAGTYYARIFYAAPGPYNSSTPYSLRVVYP